MVMSEHCLRFIRLSDSTSVGYKLCLEPQEVYLFLTTPMVGTQIKLEVLATLTQSLTIASFIFVEIEEFEDDNHVSYFGILKPHCFISYFSLSSDQGPFSRGFPSYRVQ